MSEAPAGERLFLADVEDSGFSAGADRGYWRLVSIDWPRAVIEVAAAPRTNAPDWFAFMFELSGYPEAPTAQPWDVRTGAALAPAAWPGGTGRVALAFNPGWRPDAIYIPMDRLALQGHEAWLSRYPGCTWDSAQDICQYLRVLYDLLNDEAYVGVRGG